MNVSGGKRLAKVHISYPEDGDGWLEHQSRLKPEFVKAAEGFNGTVSFMSDPWLGAPPRVYVWFTDQTRIDEFVAWFVMRYG